MTGARDRYLDSNESSLKLQTSNELCGGRKKARVLWSFFIKLESTVGVMKERNWRGSGGCYMLFLAPTVLPALHLHEFTAPPTKCDCSVDH